MIQQLVEAFLAILMAVAGCLTLLNKKRYLLYEMLFIYTSHFTTLLPHWRCVNLL